MESIRCSQSPSWSKLRDWSSTTACTYSWTGRVIGYCARAQETTYSEPGGDMAAFLLSGGMHGNPEPEGLRDIVGPTVSRGTTNGLIVRGGRIVAEWGDTNRADMTFSTTKSYLSTVVGLAWGDGLLALDDKIGSSVRDGGFDGDHNSKITWRHMLHQASEWTGTLFTKPDSVDHNRSVGGAARAAAKGTERELNEPGTFCALVL